MWGWIVALLEGFGKIFNMLVLNQKPEKKEVVNEQKNLTPKTDDDILHELGLERVSPSDEGDKVCGNETRKTSPDS